MQNVTIPKIAKRLQKLPAEKLALVYDFVSYLAERESKSSLPLAPGRRITRRLDQVYASEPSTLEPAWTQAQIASLERETW